jgi:hypothetical protein
VEPDTGVAHADTISAPAVAASMQNAVSTQIWQHGTTLRPKPRFENLFTPGQGGETLVDQRLTTFGVVYMYANTAITDANPCAGTIWIEYDLELQSMRPPGSDIIAQGQGVVSIGPVVGQPETGWDTTPSTTYTVDVGQMFLGIWPHFTGTDTGSLFTTLSCKSDTFSTVGRWQADPGRYLFVCDVGAKPYTVGGPAGNVGLSFSTDNLEVHHITPNWLATTQTAAAGKVPYRWPNHEAYQNAPAEHELISAGLTIAYIDVPAGFRPNNNISGGAGLYLRLSVGAAAQRIKHFRWLLTRIRDMPEWGHNFRDALFPAAPVGDRPCVNLYAEIGGNTASSTSTRVPRPLLLPDDVKVVEGDDEPYHVVRPTPRVPGKNEVSNATRR